MQPEKLLDNPLYVWGAAALSGFLTDAEFRPAGKFIYDLIESQPERFDRTRIVFQCVAIGHLIAQYAPQAPVERFVKLCSEAGFRSGLKPSRKPYW